MLRDTLCFRMLIPLQEFCTEMSIAVKSVFFKLLHWLSCSENDLFKWLQESHVLQGAESVY